MRKHSPVWSEQSARRSPATASPWADNEAIARRIFVADHTSPTITAIDINAPDLRWAFEVTGLAKLYPSADEALIVAVQSDNDQVDFLCSGLPLD